MYTNRKSDLVVLQSCQSVRCSPQERRYDRIYRRQTNEPGTTFLIKSAQSDQSLCWPSEDALDPLLLHYENTPIQIY